MTYPKTCFWRSKGRRAIYLLLSMLLLAGCGGGSLAPGGRPAGTALGEQTQVLDVALRLDIQNTRNQNILAQGEGIPPVADIVRLEVRVLDAQSLVEVIEPVIFNPNTFEGDTLTLENVPVGFRILRIEGFTADPFIDNGLPVAATGYFIDLAINVRPGANNIINVQVDGENGITGNVPDDGIPVGRPGEVRQIGDVLGVDESDPTVDAFGLQLVMAYRRDNGQTAGDIIVDAFRTDSVDYAGPITDLDGSETGRVANEPGLNDRIGPSIALDQLGTFSVVWEDATLADVNGRSYDADANPIAAEEFDITLSPQLGFDPIRPILASTTNPNPPPREGFGGEVRHLLYLGLLGNDSFMGFKTFEADNMDCDPVIECDPDSDLIDCVCLIVDDICLSLPDPFPFPFPDSHFAMGVYPDGFENILAFEDHENVWIFSSRPWVGLNALDLFQVNPESGTPGEMDIATMNFSFALGDDQYLIVYEMDGTIFSRSYEAQFDNRPLEVTEAIEIATGTQPRAAAANTTEFYVTWIDENGEVMIDLFEHATGNRVSENPPHLVSDALVTPGTSSNPRIAASSFGAVVVWEATDSNGDRGVFEKRFNVGFQP